MNEDGQAKERRKSGNTDLISRQAAIEEVRQAYENDEMFDGYEYRLEELPFAQLEIIRCKDCKYRDVNWRRALVKWLPCMRVCTGDNWYCGSAERREE